jgi:hypothetical protein
MGDGSAPLQPLEVGDCAARIAALALGEASLRVRHDASQGLVESSWARLALLNQRLQYTLRVYDAVRRGARPGNGHRRGARRGASWPSGSRALPQNTAAR